MHAVSLDQSRPQRLDQHALAVDAAIFVVAFLLQFSVRRYIPAVYWLAVVAVGIVGTVTPDVVHFFLGVPLWTTVNGCAAVLVVNFVLWHRAEKTLSIHSINTRRREVFYWITVFFTFALGTAAGDLSADVWHLGYLGSAVLFLVLIAVPAVAYRFGINAALTFWVAYLLTRPLGASIADWLSFPYDGGGLNLGPGPVTWVATTLIAVLVACLSRVSRAEKGVS